MKNLTLYPEQISTIIDALNVAKKTTTSENLKKQYTSMLITIEDQQPEINETDEQKVWIQFKKEATRVTDSLKEQINELSGYRNLPNSINHLYDRVELFINDMNSIRTEKEQEYDKLTEFFESEGFNVEIWDSFDNDFVEISKQSECNFEFIFTLSPYSKESFKEQVDNFDIEHEINNWTNDGEYSGMSYNDMFIDFTEFHESLKQTLNRLQQL